jgi:ribosomal protein S17E
MFPGKFSSDYEKNKGILKEVVELSSKNLRNQLAGSITNLLKNEVSQIA